MYGNELQDILEQVPCTCEPVVTACQAGFIRTVWEGGHIYFIAQQKSQVIDQWVTLGIQARSAMLFNPLDGTKGQAYVRRYQGKTQVYLQLKPGESIIIQTYQDQAIEEPFYPIYESQRVNWLKISQSKTGEPVLDKKKPQLKKADWLLLRGNWVFTFTDGQPAIPGTWEMKGDPIPWTSLQVADATRYAGPGRYSLSFKCPKVKADDWMLDLSGLAESAKVYVNGQLAGTVWSLPFYLRIGSYLKPGQLNRIDIDVTNLPANLIADYDRRGVNWRIFKEINVVDVRYQKSSYAQWPIMPSGLTQPVKLIPLYYLDVSSSQEE
jgi:hypothetical protein